MLGYKASKTMRAVVVAAVTMVAFAPTARAGAHPAYVTTTVRGGYLNDLSCVPIGLSPAADPQTFHATCTGGSIYDGSFTGHTVVYIEGTVTTTGAAQGDFVETLVGTYAPDHRTGSLTFRGHFSSDENQVFTASARIIGGSCGFAGSSGTLQYDGTAANGGYTGQWTHPAAAPSDEPCIPTVPTLQSLLP